MQTAERLVGRQEEAEEHVFSERIDEFGFVSDRTLTQYINKRGCVNKKPNPTEYQYRLYRKGDSFW
jgi:hypothetical protein